MSGDDPYTAAVGRLKAIRRGHTEDGHHRCARCVEVWACSTYTRITAALLEAERYHGDHVVAGLNALADELEGP